MSKSKNQIAVIGQGLYPMSILIADKINCLVHGIDKIILEEKIKRNFR